MNCKQVRLKLSAYQDGESGKLEAEEIQSHLQICDDCKREYENLKSVEERLIGLRTYHLPLNFSAKTMSRIKEKELKKNRLFGFNLAYIVYSLLFVFFITAGMFFIDIKTNKNLNNNYNEETNSYITSLLHSEQELGLLDIQDNFVKLIESETNNEN